MIQRTSLLVAALLITVSTGLRGQVDPAAVIEQARVMAALQQTDLHGHIRKGRSKVPVSLFLRGENIQFALQGGAERFHMRLKDDECELLEIVNGKTRKFSSAKLVEPISGTDLNYEDLALRFFYWPKPSLEGSERVNGFDCWKIRLNNPRRDGNYAVVYVWVHKKFGAFMRIRGHNRQGLMLKQFEVEEVMPISKGVYTIRKMQVDTMKSDGKRVAGSTWIEFDRPKKVDPGGLR